MKSTLIGTSILFSGCSTGLVNWALKGYVTRIFAETDGQNELPNVEKNQVQSANDYEGSDSDSGNLNEEDQEVSIDITPSSTVVFETLSMFNTPIYTRLQPKYIEEKRAPFATWRVKDDPQIRNRIKILNGGKIKREKFFVHVEAAELGVLGEEARQLVEAVESEEKLD